MGLAGVPEQYREEVAQQLEVGSRARGGEAGLIGMGMELGPA